MKRIGLLGGMSWESSAEYYRFVNEAVRERSGGLHSADCVLRSVDFAPIARMQEEGRWDEAAERLGAEARSLVAAGAELVVLCTNTMHRVAGAVAAAVDVPFVHIADTTARAVRDAGISRVGLLATAYTMEQDFYVGRLRERHGLEVLVPPAGDRRLVHDVIYAELCRGTVDDGSRREMRRIMAALVDDGAEAVLLGCTELELLVGPGDASVPLFDTTRLHARRAVELALADAAPPEEPGTEGGDASLAAAVAHVIGVPADEVPTRDDLVLAQWLAHRGLGPVPVEDPGAFRWPGRFLGRRRDTRAWVVLFGVPPGVVWPPDAVGAATPLLDAAFVLAPHEVVGVERGPATATGGTVELIAVADRATAPMRTAGSARALAGRGLEGDRYAEGAGTFSDGRGRGYDLTLVEGEALDELASAGVPLVPEQARRNLVVRGIDLDALIGRRFRVGGAECLGQRRCEPCAHLERLTRPGVLRALVHRGGLRADVLVAGEIRVGDSVEVVEDGADGAR